MASTEGAAAATRDVSGEWAAEREEEEEEVN